MKFCDSLLGKAKVKEALFIAALAVLILFAGFSCFYNLNRETVHAYDESRHGVSAYEMIKNNNYIVNTYNYEPDYWNLKPPLSFWAIVLGYKLFGYGALGMRFYSAVAMFLNILICGYFIYRRYGRIACIFSVTLLSSYRYFYHYHFARNGDADSLYVFFFTVGILSLFYLGKNQKFIYINGLCFALAFLTKSWHACLMPVITLTYLVLSKDIKLLKKVHILGYALFAALPILAWAALRYQYDGFTFFIKMFQVDFLNRTMYTVERHYGNGFYYFRYVFFPGNYYGTLFIALAAYVVLVCIIRKQNFFSAFCPKKDFMLFMSWIFIPFILYSSVKTKITWYIYPAVVPLLMFVSVMFSKIFNYGKHGKIRLIQWAIYLFAATVIIWNARLDTVQILNSKESDFQRFAENVVFNNRRVDGSEVYLLFANGDWPHDCLFLSEVYGDVKCRSGGIKAFMDIPHGIAFDRWPDYQNHRRMLTDCRIIAYDENFLILEK